ncbi:MAG: 50S ribosomal protein L32 [Planctomycetes bacterium]|jgi:large subunit ribosomal protein L32|nr:50S ribosomal protein L32 [Planctomycetota bacterium]
MSVPPKRRTASSARRRRSHDALKKTTLSACPKCGKATKPHMACAFCGTYKGKQVVKIKSTNEKKKK